MNEGGGCPWPPLPVFVDVLPQNAVHTGEPVCPEHPLGMPRSQKRPCRSDLRFGAGEGRRL